VVIKTQHSKGESMQEIVMPFDSKLVEVVRDDQGTPWVSVRSICNNIGVDSKNQIEKLKTNPTYKGVSYHLPSAGGPQATYCLPLSQLNLWLGGINPMKTKEPVRSNLIAYQRECAEILYKHFMPRGEADLSQFMSQFTEFSKEINAKLDHMMGATQAVFGNDEPEITDLVKQVADKYKVDGRTIWGWIQTDCDVGSYKKQNLKIKNYLKNKLGIGLQLVEKGKG
jgi:hypothetical protein